MTSLAFILGVVPLIVSRGAGAEMRQTLGTAVFSGMLGVTLFGLLLTPVFFYSIDWLGECAPVPRRWSCSISTACRWPSSRCEPLRHESPARLRRRGHPRPAAATVATVRIAPSRQRSDSRT